MTERVILLFLIIAVVCEIINLATSFNERDNVYEKGYIRGRDEGFRAGFDLGKAAKKDTTKKSYTDIENSFKEEP